MSNNAVKVECEQLAWPHNTDMDAFKRVWMLEGEPLWERVFAVHLKHAMFQFVVCSS